MSLVNNSSPNLQTCIIDSKEKCLHAMHRQAIKVSIISEFESLLLKIKKKFRFKKSYTSKKIQLWLHNFEIRIA